MLLQLMDRNPEFAQVLNNPQQLQEAMQAASNPVSAAACCKAPESIGSAYCKACILLIYLLTGTLPLCKVCVCPQPCKASSALSVLHAQVPCTSLPQHCLS